MFKFFFKKFKSRVLLSKAIALLAFEKFFIGFEPKFVVSFFQTDNQ